MEAVTTAPGFFDRVRERARRIVYAHLEFNYASVAPHVPRGSRLLDLGAWNGKLGTLLRDRLGCAVTNSDVEDHDESGLPFLRFDGERLPVGAAAFDVVTVLYVLHHAADDLAILREARRVLVPGGRVVVAEDMVENAWQRAIAIGFHVLLFLFTGMGWSGSFRKLTAWRERFADADLVIEKTVELGRHMGLPGWPRNVVFVLRAADDDQSQRRSL